MLPHQETQLNKMSCYALQLQKDVCSIVFCKISSKAEVVQDLCTVVMIWSGWLSFPNTEGTYVSGSVMDIHTSDFTHSHHAGNKSLPWAWTFMYSHISFTRFNLSILMSPQHLTVTNLCKHKTWMLTLNPSELLAGSGRAAAHWREEWTSCSLWRIWKNFHLPTPNASLLGLHVSRCTLQLLGLLSSRWLQNQARAAQVPALI